MTTSKKKGINGKDDTTGSTDPVSHTLAHVAVELATLAERCQEASKRVRGTTGNARYVIVRDLAGHIRQAGDGLHEKARGLEDFMRGA